MKTKLDNIQSIFYIIILFILILIGTIILTEYINFQNHIYKFYSLMVLIPTYSIITLLIIRYLLYKIKIDNKYLQSIQDSSQNFIVIIEKSKIKTINKSFLEFLEYKDLFSFNSKYKCISELFIKKEGYVSQTMNGEYWVQYIRKNPNILHKLIMKKNDIEYIFLVEINKINIDETDKSIIEFIDITKFETLHTRYQLAINGTQDGLWDWNILTDEVYFSAQWKKQLGYEKDELENNLITWKERVHPNDLEQVMKDIQLNINNKTLSYENQHRLKHKDGSWIWILDRGQTIYDDNGKPLRMVGFHTDITEKKHIEQVLQDKEEIMIAQSKNAAMGEMISMLAHQWRQPLSVISMGANNIMADIELQMVDEKSLREISSEIITQTNELSKTIDDFRNFFKPKKDKEYISVTTIIDDAISVINTSLKNNNIKLETIFNSTKKIHTYSRDLMQVILNILKNAKEMFIENNIKERILTITVTDCKNDIEIVINDNAGGIPNKAMPKMFEPYFTTKNNQNGTGLGLYMSKIIVEKHLNGNINASNYKNGASFKIILKENINEK